MSLLSLPANTSYYLYMPAADMRCTFEGLCGLVRNQMSRNPMDSHVYIFINRRASQVKLLLWEKDGFAIYHKRLEAGTFEKPVSQDDTGQVRLTRTQLQFILDGVKLKSVTYRKRYRKEATHEPGKELI